MSLSNILYDDVVSPFKAIKANSIEVETFETTTLTASSLVASTIQATDRFTLGSSPLVNKVWAGVDIINEPVTKRAGHCLVQFSTTNLGIGATARITLTNPFFLQNALNVVSKGPFTGAGESAGARLIDVCCSFKTNGSMTIAIINNGAAAYAGNVEFDYMQF